MKPAHFNYPQQTKHPPQPPPPLFTYILGIMVNLIIGTSLLLIFIVIEALFLSVIKREKLPWKEIMVNVNSGHILLWVFRGIILMAYLTVFSYVRQSWIGLAALPVYLQWIIAFFAWDFCYYWSHRMHHTFSFLWAIHSVHHQGEHFNLSLGIRNSWFQSLTSFPFFLILAVAGIAPEIFIIVSSIHYFIQFYNHNALVKKSGFLEYFMVTPSHHRVHHGTNDLYLNRNHGGTFVIWDKLFGTFQAERDDIEIKYGMTERFTSGNTFWANIEPLLHWLGFSTEQWRTGSTEPNKKTYHLPDGYLTISSLTLFLLLLVYIQYEHEWLSTEVIALFSITFTGTLLVGAASNGHRLFCVLWPVFATVAGGLLLFVLDYSEYLPFYLPTGSVTNVLLKMMEWPFLWVFLLLLSVGLWGLILTFSKKIRSNG